MLKRPRISTLQGPGLGHIAVIPLSFHAHTRGGGGGRYSTGTSLLPQHRYTLNVENSSSEGESPLSFHFISTVLPPAHLVLAFGVVISMSARDRGRSAKETNAARIVE
jgi:hypothetical protein